MTALEIGFWCSVGFVIYAYAGYPCALALIALVRSRPLRKGDVRPLVSFIITAHNEERGIGAKILNTLAQDYPRERMEVIVASDCSTDRTDAIAKQFEGRLTLVRTPERRGKEGAQQVAVAHATGQVLVFSDVATALAADAVSSIVGNFSDPEVGCVSSIDRFVGADGRVSGEGVYVKYEMWLRTLESRVNSLVGLSGSFFAARREVCLNWAADRQSDFNTLLNSVELGLRGVLDPESIGYYRDLTDTRHEFQRKVRTVVRGLRVLAANRRMLNPVRHGLFGWQLASHKLCRWLVPFALLAAFLSGAALAATSPVFLGLFSAQVVFYAAAAAGLRTKATLLRLPCFLVVSNLAVLLAWVCFMRGERMVTWSPSRRAGALPQIGIR